MDDVFIYMIRKTLIMSFALIALSRGFSLLNHDKTSTNTVKPVKTQTRSISRCSRGLSDAERIEFCDYKRKSF